MDRDPSGGLGQTAGSRFRLRAKPDAGKFIWLTALVVLLMALTGCRAKPLPTAPIPMASPTELINTLADFEPALARAAASFEVQEVVEPSPAWQGAHFLVNGEPLTALQAQPDLTQEQVTQAFAAYAAALNPPIRYWRSQRLGVFYTGTDGGVVLLVSGLMGDPQKLEASGQEEPYPPAVLAAIQRVSQVAGLPPSALSVESYQAVRWPDSCLGLPEPAEECVAGPVRGWQVQLRADDQIWQVHSDDLGEQIRLR